MSDQAAKLRRLAAGGAPPAREPARDVPAEPFPVTARVIAITSGKGGVGKTTLAVNLALLLAEEGARVLIVDADLGLANVDVMLGLDSSRHMGHLLLPGYEAADISTVGPRNIRVISGGSGLRELAEASPVERRLLIGKLRTYFREFDYVFIDTSPGIGAEVIDFLREADDICLVTTPEPTSLRDTYAATKAIASHLPESEIQLIVNVAGSETEAKKAVEALNAVTYKFLDRRSLVWRWVESDPTVARAVRQRVPVALSYPRSPAALSMRRLAKSLVQPVVRPACAPISEGDGELTTALSGGGPNALVC